MTESYNLVTFSTETGPGTRSLGAETAEVVETSAFVGANIDLELMLSSVAVKYQAS